MRLHSRSLSFVSARYVNVDTEVQSFGQKFSSLTQLRTNGSVMRSHFKLPVYICAQQKRYTFRISPPSFPSMLLPQWTTTARRAPHRHFRLISTLWWGSPGSESIWFTVIVSGWLNDSPTGSLWLKGLCDWRTRPVWHQQYGRLER